MPHEYYVVPNDPEKLIAFDSLEDGDVINTVCYLDGNLHVVVVCHEDEETAKIFDVNVGDHDLDSLKEHGIEEFITDTNCLGSATPGEDFSYAIMNMKGEEARLFVRYVARNKSHKKVKIRYPNKDTKLEHTEVVVQNAN
jgi:hypothetical protein